MPTRCLIYAHWDVNGIVDAYVLHSLRAYRSAFEVIVFVSTNYQVPSPELEALVDRIIVRDNQGFDFGSWQTALGAIDTSRFDEVIFTNSSAYGPLWPIERVFGSPAIQGADVWGMTISEQHAAHLQSYFMGMSNQTLESAFGRRLWGEVRPFHRKVDAIEAYELRWLARCEAAGLKVRAVYDARERGDRITLGEWLANGWPITGRRAQPRRYRRTVRHTHPNPCHVHWKRVLEAGVPLLKVDLFTLNPCGLRLSRVRRWIERHTDYPYELIRAHANRIQRNRMAA